MTALSYLSIKWTRGVAEGCVPPYRRRERGNGGFQGIPAMAESANPSIAACLANRSATPLQSIGNANKTVRAVSLLSIHGAVE